MTEAEILRTFNAKGRSGKWRAKCPCHKSRSLSLAIYRDPDRISFHCHAGCTQDDVLAAVGLTWRDVVPKRERLPPAEYKALQAKRRAEEKAIAQMRLDARYWTDQTRLWERIANRMHDALQAARETPQEAKLGRLWRKCLATARGHRERLWDCQKALTPGLDRYKAGCEVEG